VWDGGGGGGGGWEVGGCRGGGVSVISGRGHSPFVATFLLKLCLYEILIEALVCPYTHLPFRKSC